MHESAVVAKIAGVFLWNAFKSSPKPYQKCANSSYELPPSLVVTPSLVEGGHVYFNQGQCKFLAATALITLELWK